MDIDWSKAPEGTTHHHAENETTSAHWKKDGFFCVVGLEAEGWKKEFVAYDISRYTARPIPWDGEGLPPVGTVCEWHPSVHGLVEVTILGRDGEDTWYRVKGEHHSQTCANMAFFRPIKTAEQIAAEEREAEILEIFHATGLRKRDGGREVAEAIYRAGYRKQVAP